MCSLINEPVAVCHVAVQSSVGLVAVTCHLMSMSRGPLHCSSAMKRPRDRALVDVSYHLILLLQGLGGLGPVFLASDEVPMLPSHCHLYSKQHGFAATVSPSCSGGVYQYRGFVGCSLIRVGWCCSFTDYVHCMQPACSCPHTGLVRSRLAARQRVCHTPVCLRCSPYPGLVLVAVESVCNRQATLACMTTGGRLMTTDAMQSNMLPPSMRGSIPVSWLAGLQHDPCRTVRQQLAATSLVGYLAVAAPRTAPTKSVFYLQPGTRHAICQPTSEALPA